MDHTNPAAEIKKDLLDEYKGFFPQFLPDHGEKWRGKRWSIVPRPLTDRQIKDHLNGHYDVASRSLWYPQYFAIDIDSRDFSEAQDIRAWIGLDERNSLMCTSESADSYHVYARGLFNDNPPTKNLLQTVLKNLRSTHHVEVYPHAKRVFRLPFGPKQAVLLDDCALRDFNHKMEAFLHLDPVDLKALPNCEYQQSFDFHTPANPENIGAVAQGWELYENGLQCSSSRHDAQFKIALAMWRGNFDREIAISSICRWIDEKHNGFSKEILTTPLVVYADIHRQVNHIYNTYTMARYYPDGVHNLHNGYLSKPDLQDVIRITGGSLPKIRFLSELVRHFNPRRFRRAVSVHRNNFIMWGSTESYMKRLHELEQLGIVERGDSYEVRRYSKSLTLNWSFRDSQQAILYDGRALDPDCALRLAFTPEEFKEELRKAGEDRRRIPEKVKAIFDCPKNSTHTPPIQSVEGVS